MALAALRRKKELEGELEQLYGRRQTLETQVRPPLLLCWSPRRHHAQVNAIESANINLETMNIMRESAGVLKHIHGKLCVDPSALPTTPRLNRVHSDVNKVDQTMEEVREQMEVATEISQAISTPIPTGHDVRLLPSIDEDCRLTVPHRSTRTSWSKNSNSSNSKSSTTASLPPRLFPFIPLAPQIVRQQVRSRPHIMIDRRCYLRTVRAPPARSRQEEEEEEELRQLQAELAS